MSGPEVELMDEAPEDAILLCFRVEDVVVPPAPAVEGKCMSCGARVWVAATSPRRAKVECLQCGWPKASRVAITRTQIAALSQHMRRRAH